MLQIIVIINKVIPHQKFKINADKNFLFNLTRFFLNASSHFNFGQAFSCSVDDNLNDNEEFGAVYVNRPVNNLTNFRFQRRNNWNKFCFYQRMW